MNSVDDWRGASSGSGSRLTEDPACAGANLTTEGALIVRGLVILGCATFWVGAFSLIL